LRGISRKKYYVSITPFEQEMKELQITSVSGLIGAQTIKVKFSILEHFLWSEVFLNRRVSWSLNVAGRLEITKQELTKESIKC
jgi:hypothetical protein